MANNSRRRKSTCICVLLATACSPAVQVVQASSSPKDSSHRVGSIQHFRDPEPLQTDASIVTPRRTINHVSGESHTDFISFDSYHSTEAGNTITSKKKSSISINTTGIFSILQNIVLNSPKPLLRTATFTAQLAIAAYITKLSWNVIKEAWDEVNEEYANQYRKADDGREEQDMPYVDSQDVTDLDSAEGKVDSTSSTKGHQSNHQLFAMRDLANRLRSAGIPYASEVEYESGSCRSPRTVESVIKSLTRSEGNVLSQTLLTPMNDGSSNQDSPESAATKAWNAIGGLAQAKESLLDLAFPLLPSSTESNNYYGGLLANPPGVLLFGPPGCGKSMLVRALASTVGARFLVVAPSCLLRKYVGETNLNVRALFSVAAKISPCVIFVDELDGLFRERGGEDHDVSRDLKTEFLQLWDGVRHNHLQGGIDSSSSSVLVIGATNRPFDVDPAFLRRMPRRIFIGLPDRDARVQVLTNMLQGVPLEKSFDIDLVARQTRGYSPSDMREVLQAAALIPLREARADAMSSRAATHMPLSIPPLRKLRTDDVLKALLVAKPTHFSKQYERDLTDYVQRSGGSQSDSYAPETNSPSVTFSSEYFNNEEQDSSEDYSYDESESDDYDEL